MSKTLTQSEPKNNSPIGPIPINWSVIQLSNICEHITKGATPTTFGHAWAEGEGVLFLRSECVGDGFFSLGGADKISLEAHQSMSRSAIRAGDLLMTITGNIGRLCRFPNNLPESNINQHIARIRVSKVTDVDSNYIFWALQHPEQLRLLRIEITGIAYPQIGLTQVQNITLPLPIKNEQKKIAEILDTIDNLITLTDRHIAKLKLAKAGLLHDLLTRGIDEHGELRDPIAYPEQFKETGTAIGKIPKGWFSGRMQVFCDEIVVGVVCNATDNYTKEGIPFVRSQNVKVNYVDTNDLLHITPSFNSSQKKSILKTGDVIIVRTGAYTGMAASVPDCLDGSNCFSLVICRPNRSVLDPVFFSQYINSPNCQNLIARTYFGSAQPNFNISEAQKLSILIPCLHEQKGIIKIINCVDSKIQAKANSLEKLRLLKKGLMADLLTGRVRVNLDNAEGS